MNKTSIVALITPLFWIICPEALVHIGQSAGQGKYLFYLAIAIGFILSLITVSLLHHPELQNSNGDDQLMNMSASLGLLPATTFTVASHVGLVLLLPTGILVTAGFTFNETFVYWFPNFGFSFLLLGTILIIHLAGQRFVDKTQTVFLSFGLISLLFVIFFGLFRKAPDEIFIGTGSVNFSLLSSLICTSLLFFLGHNTPPVQQMDRASLYFSLFITALFLILWGGVSLKFVNPAKLAQSTIPYILTGREILNQTGRLMIGIAVIAGTCALVNALFRISTNELSKVTKHLLGSSRQTDVLQKLFPILFTALIAALMAIGLAGSEFIDTYIYGALLLWMLLIGIQCLAATLRLQKIKNTVLPHYFFVSAVYPVAAFYLTAMHQHSARLAVLCFLMLFIGMTWSVTFKYLGTKIYPHENSP